MNIQISPFSKFWPNLVPLF